MVDDDGIVWVDLIGGKLLSKTDMQYGPCAYVTADAQNKVELIRTKD